MQNKEKMTITEEHAVHHTMAFARMNPPHAGHGEVVDKVNEVQKKHGGTSSIVLSRSHDSKKNPLTPEQKVHHAQNAFPHAHFESDDGLLQHLSKLHKKGVTHLHMVAGTDRIEGFKKLIHQYNGKKGPHGYYNFKHVTFHSSGERDPDAEGIEGYSASKMREHAQNNDFKSFSAAAARTMKPKHVREMFNDVRNGLASGKKKKLKEEACAEHFKALFLVGGPGSGKDFLIHSALNEFNMKEVSMERIFTAIVKETNIEELENFPSVIVNGNADNYDKVLVTKTIMEEMGYDTSMIYVYSTDESSKARNDYRIARGLKTFSEEVRKEKYNSSIKNIEQFLDMFESFILYDNSNNFVLVDDHKKQEITGWLTEMNEHVMSFLSKDPSKESVYEWIQERVMEVGTYDTNRFHNIITPGQISNEVRTYAEADKIIPPPKFGKQDPRDGDKYIGGGVASAGRNSNQRTIPENATHHSAHKHGERTINPSNYASTGATTSMGTGDIGVASTTGQTSEEEDKIPVGQNGTSPQSFSGITEKLIKNKIKNKIKPATPPSDLLKFNAAGGGGDYVPSVGGIQEKKKLSKYAVPTNSNYGNVQSLGAPTSVGMYGYKEETKKKKKPINTPVPSDALGKENEMGSETLTATLESIKYRALNVSHNFDQELEK